MSLGSQPSFDAMSTFPQGFANGLVVQGIPILNTYPGRVVWLDSVNGSDTNKGTFARPFATLMGAQYFLQQQAPSIYNDVIMVKPGHQETITAPRTAAGAPSTSGGTATAGSMSIDLSGLQIIGLGIGDDRPRFTFQTANTATLNITGSNVVLQNVLFLGNFLSIASAINIGGSVAGTGLAAVTASISGNVMTVSASSAGYLYPGSTLWSTTAGFLRGTKVVAQLSGTAGGVGTYTVNYSQTVASGAVTSVARNVSILNCEFRDVSSVLGFVTWITTSATNNACDGFSFIGNTIFGLAAGATSAITMSGNTSFANISQNNVNLAANALNANTAMLLAKTTKVTLGLTVSGNRCYRPVTGTVTAGMLVSTTSTTDTGMLIDNYVLGGSGALTGLLVPTGTGLAPHGNYIEQAADKSATLLPIAA